MSQKSVLIFGRTSLQSVTVQNLAGTAVASVSITGSPVRGIWELTFASAGGSNRLITSRRLGVAAGLDEKILTDVVALSGTSTVVVPGVTVTLAAAVAATDRAQVEVIDEGAVVVTTEGAVKTAPHIEPVTEYTSLERAAATYVGATVDLRKTGYCAVTGALNVAAATGTIQQKLQISIDGSNWVDVGDINADADTTGWRVNSYDATYKRALPVPEALYARTVCVVSTNVVTFAAYSVWSTRQNDGGL